MSERNDNRANTHNEEITNENDCIIGTNDEISVCFERVTDIKYAKIQKKLQWWSLNNVRLIAYSAFFLVLALFSAYYFSVPDYFVATLAAVAGIFVIYLILSGAGYFGLAHTADEELENKTISLKISEQELHIKIDDKFESLSVGAIKDIRIRGNSVYFKLKGSSLCPCGITFELDDIRKKSDLKKLVRKK